MTLFPLSLFQLPEDPAHLRCAVGCLRAVVCALSPDTLVPPTHTLHTAYPPSTHSYDPRPLDTSE